MNNIRPEGIIVPLVTPMNDDGSINVSMIESFGKEASKRIPARSLRSLPHDPKTDGEYTASF